MIRLYTHKSPEVKYLLASDSKMKKLIKKIGPCKLSITEDPFTKLVKSIIGQQLSVKATRTITGRVNNLCGEITPHNILKVQDNSFRVAGVSSAKTSYIKGLAKKVLQNEIDFDLLHNQTNGEIIDSLTSIKGIGKWTAEMFLIFSLGRLDVFSPDDAGLKRAIRWLYCYESTPSCLETEKTSEPWKPYRSLASLYLWAAIDTNLIYENSSNL